MLERLLNRLVNDNPVGKRYRLLTSTEPFSVVIQHDFFGDFTLGNASQAHRDPQ
ncbi:hypothetical protein KW466_06100 [Vibrio fluvialis]|nr:hypothetical protein [Vibrio fluvialis]